MKPDVRASKESMMRGRGCASLTVTLFSRRKSRQNLWSPSFLVDGYGLRAIGRPDYPAAEHFLDLLIFLSSQGWILSLIRKPESEYGSGRLQLVKGPFGILRAAGPVVGFKAPIDTGGGWAKARGFASLCT